MTVLHLIKILGAKIPSTKTKSGFLGKLKIALFIDNNDACKIFNFSISLTEAIPIENKELFLISFDISILCSKVSFFESFKFFIWTSFF